MSAATDPFFHATLALLTEIFDGPPGQASYVLNPGDPGLLRELESLDAHAASTRPMPGRTTIAAHVDHVLFGIDLLNRWQAGEENPWMSADWDASWKRPAVDEIQWRDLLTRLRAAVAEWQRGVAARTEWTETTAAGALASVVHTAYHLGAIRQILAAQR